MRRLMIFACVLLGFGAAVPDRGHAANFLIGVWQYGGCVLRLKEPNALGQYAAETNFCSGQWAFVSTWRPWGSGAEVLTILNDSVARLSLENGELVTVLNTGKKIAFKRTSPPPAGSAPQVAAGGGRIAVLKPHPYVAGIPCVKRGSSDTCASAYDLGLPRSLPFNSTSYTRPVNVTVFTGLNFRAKIGYDQKVLFTIQSGLCVPIWACFDQMGLGPWCVTRLNGQQGYIAKFSKRSDGTMQVNFGNGFAG